MRGEPQGVWEGVRRLLEDIRILLVEDNAFNQMIASETLRMLGAKVDLAENGRIACDMLEADPRYDIVLMDVQMPVMDGCAATRLIRGELGLDLPILAMTAGDLSTERELCIAAGMDDFVAKPFHPENLQQMIRKCIQGRKGGGASTPAVPPRERDAYPTGVVPGVFEPDHLVGLLGDGVGAVALVRKLVLKFLELTPRTLQEGRSALERGDEATAMRTCHNLKATAASLGAVALSEAAKHAEAVFAESGGADRTDALGRVEAEYARIEGHARRWLSTEP